MVYARIVKHRSDAQELVEGGCLRVNRVRITKGSHAVRTGDVLTVAWAGKVKVLQVVGEAERRGPPAAARTLYQEMGEEMHDGAAQKQDASPSPLC